MASEKTKTGIIVGMVALVAVLILGGFTFLVLKVRAHGVQTRALAELKADNPVEYYVLHTPMIQSEDELKSEMVGTWRLKGAKSQRTGGFVFLLPGNLYFKSFTLTNWPSSLTTLNPISFIPPAAITRFTATAIRNPSRRQRAR